jgi:hypothetical protein
MAAVEDLPNTVLTDYALKTDLNTAIDTCVPVRSDDTNSAIINSNGSINISVSGLPSSSGNNSDLDVSGDEGEGEGEGDDITPELQTTSLTVAYDGVRINDIQVATKNDLTTFQPKITATGTTNLLTAPSAAGGQPGVASTALLLTWRSFYMHI